jgi:hypothetical protein
MPCRTVVDPWDMNGMPSVRRGVAAVSSGALVVGAGAAVGVIAADMAGQWSEQAAGKAAAMVVEDLATDDRIPRPVIVTRIKERHVTPDPVVVHRTVHVRAPSGQGGAPRARVVPQRQPTRSAAKPRPSRKVVAPAPAPAAPAAAPSAPKATSKTS